MCRIVDARLLSDDTKAGFLQGPDGVSMVDARNARHVLRGDLDFADDGSFEQHIAGGQVSSNRVLDVLEGFRLGGILRPAAWVTPVAARTSVESSRPSRGA